MLCNCSNGRRTNEHNAPLLPLQRLWVQVQPILVGHQLIIRDLPELKTVVSSSVAEVVRTKVKQTIGMKLTTDGEGDSSESKSDNKDT